MTARADSCTSLAAMSQRFAGPELLRLIDLLARLPGLGPRSARRVALHLIKRRDTLLLPLAEAMAAAGARIEKCRVCGNYDTVQPCAVCQLPGRDEGLLCVVEDVPDLWALERGGAYRGRYHVLGGVISSLDGVGPDDLGIPDFVRRVEQGDVREVILALNATVAGQTTAHYIAEQLEGRGITITRMAQGIPIGGELDQLDDGTLAAALRARRGV